MSKNLSIIILVSLMVMLGVTACKEEHSGNNPVSLEETKLILRLFDNLQKDNYQVARTQAQKLLAITPNNSYVISIIELETINIEFEKINKALADNDLALAYKLIHQLNAKYPLNENVKSNYSKISLLYNLQKEIELYKKGKVKNIEFNEELKTAFPMDYRNIESALPKK